MTIETEGPVSMADVEAMQQQLTALTIRAAENGQHGFGVVFHLAAAALVDNAEMLAEWEEAEHADGG